MGEFARSAFRVLSMDTQAKFLRRLDQKESYWNQHHFTADEVHIRAVELKESAHGELDKIGRGGGPRAMKRVLERRRDAAMLREFARLLKTLEQSTQGTD